MILLFSVSHPHIHLHPHLHHMTTFFNEPTTEEPVDLSVFSPVCLPRIGQNINDGYGHTYGNYYKK